MCCLDIFGLHRAQSLTGYSPTWQERLPTWLVAPSARLATSHLVLSLTGFTCQPSKLFKQANHIFPREPGEPVTSCYYKAHSPWSLLATLLLSAALCHPPGHTAALPRQAVHVPHKLLSVTSVHCQVVCVRPSSEPWAGLPPSPVG